MWESITDESCLTSYSTWRFDDIITTWCKCMSNWRRYTSSYSSNGQTCRIWWKRLISLSTSILLSDIVTRDSCHCASLHSKFLNIYDSLQLRYFPLFLKPFLFEARKEMFQKKYSKLFEQKIIQPHVAFGVPKLKHLSRLFQGESGSNIST